MRRPPHHTSLSSAPYSPPTASYLPVLCIFNAYPSHPSSPPSTSCSPAIRMALAQPCPFAVLQMC
eukprot:246639-Chlamydomonas_euryale.AAC.1